MDTQPALHKQPQKNGASRTRNGLSACLAIIVGWALCAILVWAVFYLAVQAYHRLWLPAGIGAPAFEKIAGDSWGFTADGRGYHLEGARWKRLDVPFSGGPLVWGAAPNGGMVILGEDGLLAGQNPARWTLYPHPVLSGTIVSVGGVYLCEIGVDWTETVYAATRSELAFFDRDDQAWKVLPLSVPLSAPVVAAPCRLFWLSAAGGIQVVTLKIPPGAGVDGVALTESALDLAKYGGASELASSTNSVWVLTRSGEVLSIARNSQFGPPLEELPAPPPVTHPHLTAGAAGSMFIPTDEGVDLWLSGDDGLFGYNHAQRTWKKFAPIYGKRPVALSALATNSDLGGTFVTRLAVVDGKVWRQNPQYGEPFWTLFVIGIPLAALLGLLAALILRRVGRI